MMALTDTQRATLDYITSHITKHGFAPTIREIGEACGGIKTNAVNDRLIALERKGYISRVIGKARTIRVLGTAA